MLHGRAAGHALRGLPLSRLSAWRDRDSRIGKAETPRQLELARLGMVEGHVLEAELGARGHCTRRTADDAPVGNVQLESAELGCERERELELNTWARGDGHRDAG